MTSIATIERDITGRGRVHHWLVTSTGRGSEGVASRACAHRMIESVEALTAKNLQ